MNGLGLLKVNAPGLIFLSVVAVCFGSFILLGCLILMNRLSRVAGHGPASMFGLHGAFDAAASLLFGGHVAVAVSLFFLLDVKSIENFVWPLAV